MEAVLIDPPILTKLKKRASLPGSKKHVAIAAGIDKGTLNRVISRGYAREDVAEKITKYVASL